MFVGFVFEQCNWKDSQFQLWLQILFRFLKRTKNLFPIWTGYSLRSRYGGRDVSPTVCVGFFSVPVIKIPQQKSKLGKEGFVFSLWCLRGQSIIVGEAWQPELWMSESRDHISFPHRKWGLWKVGQNYKPTGPAPKWPTSSGKAPQPPQTAPGTDPKAQHKRNTKFDGLYGKNSSKFNLA